MTLKTDEDTDRELSLVWKANSNLNWNRDEEMHKYILAFNPLKCVYDFFGEVMNL